MHKHKTKEGQIGTILGIQDKNDNWLLCGDTIKRNDNTGIILYDPELKTYDIYLTYSRWYGDDIYDPKSYGKALSLPMDNGAKMQLELVDRPRI